MSILQLDGYTMIHKETGLKVTTGPTAATNFVWFDTAVKPLDDVRVRKALAYAANVPAIVSGLGGLLFENPSFLPPVVFGYTTQNVQAYGENLAEAKKLLQEAGYGPTNKPKLSLGFQNALNGQLFAVKLKQSWSEVADVSLDLLADAVTYPDFIAGKGGWNVAIGRVTRLVTDQFLPLVDSKDINVLNISRWSNAEADSLVTTAITQTSNSKRAAALASLQQLVSQQVPMLPLGGQHAIIASSPHLNGVTTYPFPGIVEFSPMSFA
jgi:oligopeptide transport system substrate-binding protein